MSSEESNKMLKKTHFQDSNSKELKVSLEDSIRAVIEAAEDYDKLVGG